MAIVTIAGKCFPVVIRMACSAKCVQAKVSLIFFITEFLVAYEFFLMAVGAGFLAMGPLEFITGKIMIEIILFKTDNLKSPAMMIVVTSDTCLVRNPG